MESDDDDFDIDDILQGLDLDANTPKGSTGPKSMTTALKSDTPQTKDQQKDIMSMFQADPNPKPTAKMQSASTASKAVRFSSDSGANTKTAQQQPLPTQPISDLFFNPSSDAKPDAGKGIQRPPAGNTGPVKNPQINPIARPAQKSKDWLGIGDDKSPDDTPPQQRASFQQRNPPPSKQATVVFDSEEDEASDDNDLMRTLGLRPLSNKSSSASAPTASKPFAAPVNNPIAGTRQPPKSAGVSERPNAMLKTQQIPSSPPASNYPSSLTPKSGPASLEMMSQAQAPAPFTLPVNKDPKPPPFPNPQPQPVKTVLDSLPFLNTLATSAGSAQNLDRPPSQNQADNVQIISAAASGPGPKKKTRLAGAGNNNISDSNTLTLPSHLIDHEQLKAMASSLKTLYETQMENLEKGYTEQIEFVHQSSRRKEELLRDEIKAVQKNYENRLERLKNELQETETKVPQKLQQELNTVIQQLAVASSTIKNEKVENANQNQFDKISLINEIDKSVENKLAFFGQQIEDIITKSIRAQSSNPNNHKQMEQAFAKLQEIVMMREEDVKKMHDKIDDSDIKMSSNIRKLIREQQKMREKIIKAAASTISNELNASNQERSHRKEKSVSQVKDFHRDLRRLIYDLEVKNETMHKSQLSIEMEQKNISQTIRDLNSFLHNNATQQAINTGSGSNNISSQMSTMQAMQQQAQNEMEMKMLREERNTLSESIAKMQVERHKLNEERVLLEKDKLEFERERNRVRELEVQLRVKVSEAEDKIMQAEEVRREETQKSKNAEAKMRELESNRMYIKDQFHTAEQKLQMREQKLYQDKTEVIREKEFLDKLRDQLLCPGCLKSLTVPSSGPFIRSAGDGLDLSNVTKLPNSSTTFFTTDEPYFEKESNKFLDYLYDRH